MKTSKALLYLAFAGVIFASCEKKSTEGEKKDSSTTAPTSAATDTVVYKIDTAVSVVKWVGKKLAGSHNGTVRLQGGEVKLAGNQVVGGTLVFDMNSIKNEDLTDPTYNAKLIGHLKSEDFFNVAKYPTANLVITGAEGTTAKGNLTIKDKTGEVKAPVNVAIENGVAKIDGKTTFDRSKWDVRYGSKSFDPKLLADKIVNDEVELELNISATK